jgi:micrococcal nuclease
MKKNIISGMFLVLILMSPVVLLAQSAGAESSAARPEVKTYEELVKAIRGAKSQARARVEKAVEQERVREAWEIGRLIDAHVLQHKERADYDKQVLPKLAADLGMSDTELYYMLKFARAYPILPHAGELSWSEYRELLSVADAQARETLAKRTEKEGWSRDRLREEVKTLNKGQVLEAKAALSLSPLPLGKPGTYKIVKATVGPETGKAVIDLGFSNYYKTSKDLRFKEGAIIEATPPSAGAGSSPSDLIRLSKRTSQDLYTYRAWVVNILDGDTVKVVVDLGFGVRSVQTLRLRGIDAPEIATADGMEAKKALEKMLNVKGTGTISKDKMEPVPGVSILIKTVKSDKYDRYLADIFVSSTYVNQKLVDDGQAVIVEA